MSIKNATAEWKGTLKEGSGTIAFTGYNGPYTFASRFEDGPETNPEELIGAAYAGCYSMFLSALISGEGLNPTSIKTNAIITLEKDETGPNISNIKLECNVVCPSLTQEKFEELTKTAKAKCPISRLYEGGSAKLELAANLN